MFGQSIVQIFRDFVVDGVPSSGNHKVAKTAMRIWGAQVEAAISSAGGNIGTVYQTRAALFADLTKPANTMAWVTNDPVAGYNGVYQKVGAPNAGLWTRLSDLPYDFITGADSGEGTANAISITTGLPPSEGMIVAFTLFRDTTSSPVTLSINDGSPITIKTNRGNDASALTAGMDVWGRVRYSDSTFRLLNDQDVAALVGQAETARNDAADSAAAAASYAAGVNLPGVTSADAFKLLTPNVAGTAQVLKATYKETMRRLQQSAIRGRAIWAGQNNAYVGASGVSGGTLAAGRTFVHAAVTRNLKQDGLIRRVSLHISANGGNAGNSFKILVMRPNGASFDVIDTSDAILIGAGTGLKQFELPRPIGLTRMGDKLGIWISGGTTTASWTLAANTGLSAQFTAGLAIGGETYSTGTDADLCLFGMGSSPVIVAHGDSLFCHNGGAGHEWFTGPDGNGPTGERDSDPIYQAINRAGLNLSGLDYQNNSKGSTTWADTAALLANWTFGAAAENKLAPRIVIITCGLNDLITYAKTWTQVEKDMYTCLGLLSGIDRLFICEMPPYLGSTDGQAATIRDWNSKYATWCANNGAVLVPLHDAMGQLRVSTGFLDDPKYAVGGVDPHWTKTGVDVAGSIIAQTVLSTLI